MQRYKVYLYLETALYVSGGTITHHQELKLLYLQHLVFVRPLLLPAAITACSSNGLTNTGCCKYSCMRSSWWVEVPPETCRAVSRYNKLCNVASCWTYEVYLNILTMHGPINVKMMHQNNQTARKFVRTVASGSGPFSINWHKAAFGDKLWRSWSRNCATKL